jgi:hypothetical protein
MRISKEALFNGSWPKLSTHVLEKGFLRNPHFIFCSSFQNLRLGWVHLREKIATPDWVGQFPSQTKIREARTSLFECAFEAFFKGVSTIFGLLIIENCVENALGMVGSGFPNLRLSIINFSQRKE